MVPWQVFTYLVDWLLKWRHERSPLPHLQTNMYKNIKNAKIAKAFKYINNTL